MKCKEVGSEIEFEETQLENQNHVFRGDTICSLDNLREKLSDVDCIYWNEKSNTLYLLEMKRTPPRESDLDKIRNKVRDTFAVLNAVWLKMDCVCEVKDIIPDKARQYSNVANKKVMIIYKNNPGDIQLTTLVQNKYRSILHNAMLLNDLDSTEDFFVLSVTQAMENFGLPLVAIDV